jgi:hypothetical protein
MSVNVAPLHDFILSLADEASPLQWAAQAGVAAAGIAIGWFTAKAVCPRFQPSARWKFGAGEWRRSS